MILLFLIFSSLLIDRTHQIINGVIADVDLFKYQVALVISDKSLCAGAIIDEYHILTAAHCVYGRMTFEIHVIAGVSSLYDPGSITRQIVDIQIHSNFSDGFFVYDMGEPNFIPPLHDIAVITVSMRFELGGRLLKIDLPSDNIPECGFCSVAGWGAKEKNGNIPDRLRFVELFISSSQICDVMKIPHSFHEFCAYDPWQTSVPTSGDSGSPLNCGGVVFGINTWGSSNTIYPTVFVSVYDHLDFIKECMSGVKFSRVQ